jgi:hypothetical protein
MTPEQRLDRLERIAKLVVKSSLRERRHSRDQDERIDILINAQVHNEERFARIAMAHERLVQSQIHTDQRLDALIDIIRQQSNGGKQ